MSDKFRGESAPGDESEKSGEGGESQPDSQKDPNAPLEPRDPEIDLDFQANTFAKEPGVFERAFPEQEILEQKSAQELEEKKRERRDEPLEYVEHLTKMFWTKGQRQVQLERYLKILDAELEDLKLHARFNRSAGQTGGPDLEFQLYYQTSRNIDTARKVMQHEDVSDARLLKHAYYFPPIGLSQLALEFRTDINAHARRYGLIMDLIRSEKALQDQNYYPAYQEMENRIKKILEK